MRWGGPVAWVVRVARSAGRGEAKTQLAAAAGVILLGCALGSLLKACTGRSSTLSKHRAGRANNCGLSTQCLPHPAVASPGCARVVA